MKKEKILEALEGEFGKRFLALNEGSELHVYCPLNEYTVVVFEITRDYVVGATIMENRLVMMTGCLPCIELETEDQIIQFVKSGYCYLKDKYKGDGLK